MQRMIFALLLSLAIVLLIGPKVIVALRKLHFGQTIYELGPAHQKKQGTPMMGGIMFIVAVVICGLALHPPKWYGVWDFMLALIVVSLLSMVVGFLDDFRKAKKKQNMGLTAKQKLAVQVLVALAFSCYCYFNPYVGSVINVPFVNTSWDLGVFYIPLMTLTVMFMINSANLQDGVDGLLGTVTCIGSIGWGMMALFTAVAAASVTVAGQEAGQYQSIAVFAMALAGGTMGYLRFNYYPAKVFMGDTGSEFIGGATVGMAMLLRQPLMLLLIAFTMIMSSVSVMMQVMYFKYTKKRYGQGRRIFKMSPIHHHFEKCGMTETQIVAMYAGVVGVLTLIAVMSMSGLKL